jgi:SAM-dependent methyltransferase
MAVDYNNLTHKWNDIHRYAPASRHRRRIIINLIKGLKWASCIDAGCAQPYLLEELSKLKNCRHLYGCDIAKPVIEKNRKLFGKAKFEVVDLEKKRYPGDKVFDLVISSEVIEHIKNYGKAITNLCKMSAKYVLITVPSGKIFNIDRKVGHYRHFDIETLEKEFNKNGFILRFKRYWGFPFHTLYKNAINEVAPDVVYRNFAEAAYGPVKKMISNLLYLLFFLDYPFNAGGQLIMLAEKKEKQINL